MCNLSTCDKNCVTIITWFDDCGKPLTWQILTVIAGFSVHQFIFFPPQQLQTILYNLIEHQLTLNLLLVMFYYHYDDSLFWYSFQVKQNLFTCFISTPSFLQEWITKLILNSICNSIVKQKDGLDFKTSCLCLLVHWPWAPLPILKSHWYDNQVVFLLCSKINNFTSPRHFF